MPNDFYDTTVAELAGTSDSATYGPPYNNGGTGQSHRARSTCRRRWACTSRSTRRTTSSSPRSRPRQQPVDVSAALTSGTPATADQRTAWATAYDDALNSDAAGGDPTKVPSGDYGPVPELAKGLESMAASGALDGVLASPGNFYSTDNTKQIMFMGDGGYLDAAASATHLQGNQWGMMNETGAYPGQQWLAPFSFWYQLPFFNSEADSGLAATLTANGDIYIMAIVVLFTLVVMLMPFIPGLRRIPKAIGLHRLIWRRYYRS